MKIPNTSMSSAFSHISLARIVSEDSQPGRVGSVRVGKSSKDS